MSTDSEDDSAIYSRSETSTPRFLEFFQEQDPDKQRTTTIVLQWPVGDGKVGTKLCSQNDTLPPKFNSFLSFIEFTFNGVSGWGNSYYQLLEQKGWKYPFLCWEFSILNNAASNQLKEDLSESIRTLSQGLLYGFKGEPQETKSPWGTHSAKVYLSEEPTLFKHSLSVSLTKPPDEFSIRLASLFEVVFLPFSGSPVLISPESSPTPALPPQQPNQKLYSAEDLIESPDVAEILGMTKERVGQLCKSGAIVPIKTLRGNRKLFSSAEIENFLRDERPTGRPKKEDGFCQNKHFPEENESEPSHPEKCALDDLIVTNQVAEILELSESHVHNLLQNGTIRPVKTAGKSKLFYAPEIHRLAEQRKKNRH